MNGVSDEWVSVSDLYIFLWIITILCQTIDIFGITTNIINVVCFFKQGFNDPVNVSLLGLTLSDMSCLITSFWTSICYNPEFTAADLPFHGIEYQYLTGAIPHTTFTRITAWVTAIITMERCLCITAPLKVKQIVTTKRVSALIISVFLIFMASVAPLYVVNRLGWKYFPDRNKTLIGLLFTDDREYVESISFAINNTFVLFSAFAIIIVCTITLTIHLKQSNKWRLKSTFSDQTDVVSKRNQKVTQMVVMISALFIACFVPLSFLFLAMSMVPELSIGGKYRNTLTLIGSIGFVLESINSSTNIFIYYYTSSRYRDVLHKLFK